MSIPYIIIDGSNYYDEVIQFIRRFETTNSFASIYGQKNTLNNIKKYKVVMNNDINLDCSICFEQYKINDSLKILNCGHHFCSSCIDKWNNHTNSCPYCRQKILDNVIIDSGLTKIYFENNKFGEYLLKIINNNRKSSQKNIIDKNYLIKIDQIETITKKKII